MGSLRLVQGNVLLFIIVMPVIWVNILKKLFGIFISDC